MGFRDGRGYNPRMPKVRIIVGVVILVISLALLAWGLWPVSRVRHELRVEPTQMTLPTPSSFEPSLLNAPLGGLPVPCSSPVV